MAEVIKLNYDDGYKNIQLGDDPNRVIKINPTDMKFINRLSNIDKAVEKIQDKYGNIDLNTISDLQNLDQDNPDFNKLRAASNNVEELEKAMRELINDMFGYDICAIVFGDDWCISPANGQPRYVNFINCITEYIVSETGKLKGKVQASKVQLEEKTSKYTAHLEKPVITPNNPVNVYANPQPVLPVMPELTEDQKQALMKEWSK